MIIDFHTHIFPPDVLKRREDYARRDPTFAEMYADPKARIATAEDLLASMDESGVDVSVALGFAWQDHETCVRHNSYLLEAAAGSNGRIVPFATVNLRDDRAEEEIDRCAAEGALGLGELRPENQGWDLAGKEGDFLASIAEKYGLILLFHVAEPGDRDYTGRRGCELEQFEAFASKHDHARIVGAHLGGGIYAERQTTPDVWVDTAAQPFVYAADLAGPALAAVPTERLLLGSDFPLLSQKRQIDELRRVITDAARLDAALGANAAQLQRVTQPRPDERPSGRTLRLFVAIELPAQVLGQLNAVQHQLQRDPALAALRWTRPEGIHLTLKFLGETPAARQKDIEAAITRATADVQPFDLHLGKLGKFGSRTTPRVLWIDVEGDIPALHHLQSNVERELAQLRYPPENRAYSPHLTLARVPQDRARDVGAALDAAIASVAPPAGVISAREVALMRSELKPSGAVYTRLFAARLE